MTGLRRIYAAGVWSVIAVSIALVVDARPPLRWTPEMERAAALMESVIASVRMHRDTAGPAVYSSADPNRTGFIGTEYSGLTTTVGHLEAKRTTAQPDAAALLTHLLQRAGVDRDDLVAIGASGSFPALLAASLCAVRALGGRPVAVLSLGASSWGANDEEFNLLHVYEICRSAGVVDGPPAAVSLGGQRDVGEDLDQGIRERLRADVAVRGLNLLDEETLEATVARRMALYRAPTGGMPREEAPESDRSEEEARESDRSEGDVPAAFINAGGGWANIGDHPDVLRVRPGLHAAIPLPPPSRRGVLQAMAAEGIPVIHLLDIRGLANRYGLKWDPIPNTEAGSTPLRTGTGRPGLLFGIVAAAYVVGLLFILLPVMRGGFAGPALSATSPGRTW